MTVEVEIAEKEIPKTMQRDLQRFQKRMGLESVEEVIAVLIGQGLIGDLMRKIERQKHGVFHNRKMPWWELWKLRRAAASEESDEGEAGE